MALGQEEIAATVKRAREEADLTQQELGDRIGVTSQQVSRYERAASSIPMKQLRRIADETRKPLSFFVGDPEPPLSDPDREALATAVHQLAELGPRLSALADRMEELLGEDARPAQDVRTPG